VLSLVNPFIFIQASTNTAPITIRTRKFITNRLLARRQFVIDVLHPQRPNVSKDELSEKIAALYKSEKARVVTFGLQTQFGGGRSTGFALIYDDEASQRKFEPRYRLVRVSTRFCFRHKCVTLFTIFLVGTRKEGGETFTETAEGAQESCQEGLSTFIAASVQLPNFLSQVRGTKKLKAAEPQKKGK
jgi:ribosomal protein S24E